MLFYDKQCKNTKLVHSSGSRITCDYMKHHFFPPRRFYWSGVHGWFGMGRWGWCLWLLTMTSLASVVTSFLWSSSRRGSRPATLFLVVGTSRHHHASTFTTPISIIQPPRGRRRRREEPRLPWPSSSSTTRRFASSFFHVGENVTILPRSLLGKDDDASATAAAVQSAQYGTISEVRGGGWYSVALRSLVEKNGGGSNLVWDAADQKVIKCRSTQLRSRDDVTNFAGSRRRRRNHVHHNSTTTMEVEAQEDVSPPPSLPHIFNYDDKDRSIVVERLGPPPAGQRRRDDDDVQLVGTSDDEDRRVGGNIDEDMRRQLRHFRTNYDQWIVLTDLHVATSTWETCRLVLQTVHTAAVKRNAGILFLGDFWHVRGSLRVDLVNAVLSTLSQWTQPIIMIPGNHDQTSWHTNEQHGLRVLQNAYRIKDGDSTVPGVLILSYPTIFLDALFVPHVRDPATLEAILTAAASSAAGPLASSSHNGVVPTTVFCHADVTGSSMNDRTVSRGGISPHAFQRYETVYTGHFHKPHIVPNTTPNIIIYPGSPYQVSLSEAEQVKFLLVLDRHGGAGNKKWTVVESISMNGVGRRHYKPSSVADLERVIGMLAAGDRVVYQPATKDQSKEERDAVEMHAREIRRLGAVMEIRPAAPSSSRSSFVNGNNALLSDNDDSKRRPMEPVTASATSLWSMFIDQQVERGLIDKDMSAPGLLTAGWAILEDVEMNNSSNGTSTTAAAAVGTTAVAPTILQLETVSIRGFGPFGESQTYRLSERGLVLLRGVNEDDGADRSVICCCCW
jgi:DNA repair exonuclease SbcCD nuclease subunit